jgi:hypothetical protein
MLYEKYCMTTESYWTGRKRLYLFDNFDRLWRVYRRINKNRFSVTFQKAIIEDI